MAAARIGVSSVLTLLLAGAILAPSTAHAQYFDYAPRKPDVEVDLSVLDDMGGGPSPEASAPSSQYAQQPSSRVVESAPLPPPVTAVPPGMNGLPPAVMAQPVMPPAEPLLPSPYEHRRVVPRAEVNAAASTMAPIPSPFSPPAVIVKPAPRHGMQELPRTVVAKPPVKRSPSPVDGGAPYMVDSHSKPMDMPVQNVSALVRGDAAAASLVKPPARPQAATPVMMPVPKPKDLVDNSTPVLLPTPKPADLADAAQMPAETPENTLAADEQTADPAPAPAAAVAAITPPPAPVAVMPAAVTPADAALAPADEAIAPVVPQAAAIPAPPATPEPVKTPDTSAAPAAVVSPEKIPAPDVATMPAPAVPAVIKPAVAPAVAETVTPAPAHTSADTPAEAQPAPVIADEKAPVSMAENEQQPPLPADVKNSDIQVINDLYTLPPREQKPVTNVAGIKTQAELAQAAPAAAPAMPPAADNTLPPDLTPVMDDTMPPLVDDAPTTMASAAPMAAAAPKARHSLVFTPAAITMDNGMHATVDSAVAELNKDPSRRLLIQSFATGNRADARKLSLSRALAVRSYLMDKGIQPTRVDVRAMGNENDGGAADRVDLIIAP